MVQLSCFQSLLHCAAPSPRWIMTDLTVRRTLATRHGWRNVRPFCFHSATAIPRYCFWGAGARGGMQNVKTQITSNSQREIFTIFHFAKIVNLTLKFYFERMLKKLSLFAFELIVKIIWKGFGGKLYRFNSRIFWLKWYMAYETMTLYKW